MNIICAPSGIVDIEHPGQGIMDIVKSGFHDVLLDVSMVCSPIDLKNSGKNDIDKNNRKVRVSSNPSELHNCLIPMLDRCSQVKLNTTIAYAPYLERSSKDECFNQLLIRLAEESIKACKSAGSQSIIIRPLFSGVKQENEWLENKNYYLHLARIARENNVMILVENQCRDLNGHLIRVICSDEKTAAQWIDRLNEEV